MRRPIHIIGATWLENLKNRQHATRGIDRWLPTPGNILFTLIMIAVFLIPKADAMPVTKPAESRSTTFLPTRSQSALLASTGSGLLSYQCHLADANGNPLTGSYPMIFRLYPVASGGTHVWEEQWTGTSKIEVRDGLCNVMLGSLTPFPATLFSANDDLWLGVTVGGDPEMTPRIRLGNGLPLADKVVDSRHIALGAITPELLAPSILTLKPYWAGTTETNWRCPICDNTWVTIPGLTMTITLDEPSLLEITTSGSLGNNKAGSASYTKVFVDGSPVVAPSGDNISGCRSPLDATSSSPIIFQCLFANLAVKQVPAGTHTVDVRMTCDGGSEMESRVWSGVMLIKAYS